MIARLSLRAGLLAAAFAFAPLTAHADAFDGLEVAGDAELADARGGFITAQGVTFDLGAVISTYENGELALMTQLTWTPSGAMTTHTASNAYAAAQAAAAAADAIGAGLAVSDPTGATRIVHGVDGASLRNLVVTSASGRDFVQDIQVTITLPGFEAMQGAYALDRFNLQLGAEINALLAAAGRF